VEVDEVYKQNNLQVIAGGVATRLLKTGYYVFTAAPTSAQAPVRASVRVFQGKATVMVGKGKFVEIKGHRELALTDSATQQPVKIDTRAAKDDFYNWNSLRSQYLAEANNQIAGYYTGVAGFYPGWYWNPYMWNYTFIGMDPYWSPFGYGFYPPWWGGYYGGGYRNPGSRLHGDPGSAHPGGGAGSHIGSGFSGMGGGGMYSGGGGAGGHH
jgi:uncharacterized membrane protein YgcG